VHQAGHAVVARAVGHRIAGVSIRSGDGTTSRCHQPEIPTWFEHPSDARHRRIAEHLIMVLYGGGEAQLRVEEDEAHVLSCAAPDYRRGLELASVMIYEDDEAEAYAQWLLLRTRNLLHGPIWWAAVERLATTLLDKETLTARDARAAMQIGIAAPGGAEPTLSPLSHR
jgi:hypothetical protein